MNAIGILAVGGLLGTVVTCGGRVETTAKQCANETNAAAQCVHQTTEDPTRRESDLLPVGACCADDSPCDLVLRDDCPASTQVPRTFYRCQCMSGVWDCVETSRDMGICLKEPLDAGATPGDASWADSNVAGDAVSEPDGMPYPGGNCPVVNGSCTDGCLVSNGRLYDPVAHCLGPPVLVACFNQFDDPVSKPVPMVAPDGTCWLVFPAVGKLTEVGWRGPKPGDPCADDAVESAPDCG